MKTVLCTSDHGTGIGDAIMSITSLIDLSKNYKVKAIFSNNSYPVVEYLNKYDNIEIFNLNNQQSFYSNDFYETYNLLYWEIKNKLRNLGMHALNVIRSTCNLPLFDQNNKQELYEIPIDIDSHNKMYNLIKHFNQPLIITNPYLSYHNKMLSIKKYQDILYNINKNKLGIIIQIGKDVPKEFISPYGINLINKTSLNETISLVKLSNLVISCETFLPHLTASLKIPTIVLFCGTSPKDFGYNFHKNIYYPDLIYCQDYCGRPCRWTYDYNYNNINDCNSRNEIGWICPSKICEKVINVDDIILASEEQLEIGFDRDWKFFNNLI